MNRSKLFLIAMAFTAAGVTAGVAQAGDSDTFGSSTFDQQIVPDGASGFNTLGIGPGDSYRIREGAEGGPALGTAKRGRAKRRTDLAYFGQLTDFQLADEESPARVEFLDPLGGNFSGSWRPSEALNPQEVDKMIRQFNYFATNQPHRSGDGSRTRMDFVMNTGDLSDNNQYNETLWNRQLIEGRKLDPGSGVNPDAYLGKSTLCPAGLEVEDANNPAAYTGVQDRNDWPAPTMGYFYDPDQPDPTPVPANPGFVNPFSGFPSYPNLLDRAQKPFTPVGLKVPGYVLFGNHDGLVQGNAWGNTAFDDLAQGCLKPINDDEANSGRPTGPLYSFVLDPNISVEAIRDLWNTNPDYFMGVPPDPDRHLLSKQAYKEIFLEGSDPDGHGFGFVNDSQDSASNGSAGYYSFVPQRGIRYITLDTHSEGGKVLVSDEGNLDISQFRWFERQLQRSEDKNQIAIVFSHHAVASLDADVPDENAPSCESVDSATTPGCDADPRDSKPIMLEDDVITLMHKYPNAIAWVAGHSHVNDVQAYADPAGGTGFWSIRTAATADWPKQNRLLEIFDNRDGNISLFGTVLDQAAPAKAPPSGSEAGNFNTGKLASISRTLGYNDNQKGARACSPDPCGEGTAEDRNVELLVRDPRRPEAFISSVKIQPKRKAMRAGSNVKLRAHVTNFGTAAASKVKLKVSSSNKRVKVQRKVTISKIPANTTTTVKVRVRARAGARGKARIVTRIGKRKGVDKFRIR